MPGRFAIGAPQRPLIANRNLAIADIVHPEQTEFRRPIMERRKLGKTGLETAPLVFGGNVFGWTADEATSLALLDAFTDAGFNAIDTADAYSRWVPGHSGGESETIIGKWLKRHGGRDKVLILTKVASEMGPGKKGLSRAYIMEAVEQVERSLLVGGPAEDIAAEHERGNFEGGLAEATLLQGNSP
jgi:hypothetical protein